MTPLPTLPLSLQRKDFTEGLIGGFSLGWLQRLQIGKHKPMIASVVVVAHSFDRNLRPVATASIGLSFEQGDALSR